MKCNYCDNKSTIVMNAILRKRTVEISVCTSHKEIGKLKQDNALHEERISEMEVILRK